MKRKYLFVGEQRSPTAIRKGWRWEDRRLAGKTLHDAFPADTCVSFVNLFEDTAALDIIYTGLGCNWVVVGLGQKVQRALTRLRLPHLAMAHPAARGTIRRKENYRAHVRAVLGLPEA